MSPGIIFSRLSAEFGAGVNEVLHTPVDFPPILLFLALHHSGSIRYPLSTCGKVSVRV